MIDLVENFVDYIKTDFAKDYSVNFESNFTPLEKRNNNLTTILVRCDSVGYDERSRDYKTYGLSFVFKNEDFYKVRDDSFKFYFDFTNSNIYNGTITLGDSKIRANINFFSNLSYLGESENTHYYEFKVNVII